MTAATDSLGQPPKFSVITPTLNCGPFIRECIESVIAQDYPTFEHIVVDGASSDETVQILKQYSHLTWISEPDDGEAYALNKGLSMASGDIIGWLNADDYYSPGVFRLVQREINPARNRHVVYGRTRFVNEDGSFLRERTPIAPVTLPSLMRWFRHIEIYQPSMFLSSDLVRKVGTFRVDLPFAIDYDYWLRSLTKGYQFHFVDAVMANMRLNRQGGKTSAPDHLKEGNWERVSLSYSRLLSPLERMRFWKDFLFRYRIPRVASGISHHVKLPSSARQLLRDGARGAAVVAKLTRRPRRKG